jgi:hypothetical protein
MPSAKFKSLLAGFLGPLVFLAASGAPAQTTTSTLTKADFPIYFETPDGVRMDDTTAKYYFNRARCECDTAATVKIVIQPVSGTSAKISTQLVANSVNSGSGRLYAGAINCLSSTATERTANCTNLLDPTRYEFDFPMTIFTNGRGVYESPEIPVAYFFNSLNKCGPLKTSCDATTNCTAANSLAVYFWASTTSTADTPDVTDISKTVDLDGAAPTAPTKVIAKGGDNALLVSWTPGTTPSADVGFAGFAIYCARAENLQVFKTGSYSAPYSTAASICPETIPASGSGIAALDSNYLCSDLITSTETSHRIKGLQNGITYGVGVAAIDKSGNISAISDIVYGMPVPTVDFYTEYKNSGGTAQGGFCALGGRRDGPGILALGLLAGLGLVLRLRRRIGRRPPPAGLLLAMVGAGTLFAAQAHGQAVYHEENSMQDQDSEPWNGTTRNYAIEVRFGLYTPDVDSEFSGSGPGPHSFIFGNKSHAMWQLEFDWEVLQAFGTLSVGWAAGYYKETAQACLQATLDATGECERSGDNTSLRLIPLAVLLVYRMDEAAERWKIPLVPYGKIGLNYTIWTTTNGNDDVSSPESGGRGQGGTAGWQAAIGISLRLDFLDPAAARGFDADVGVNHSYAFFELDHIDGSGLGKKNVLHVGDNTWFAGLMFEF